MLALALALPALADSTWTATGGLANGRAEHQAVRLNDGRVLVVGGRIWTTAAGTAEIYNPATGTWSATGSPNTWHGDGTMSLLPNGRVLIAGGTESYISAPQLS